MARKIALAVGFWVLNCLAMAAFAQQASDMYRVEVPVSGQADAERVTAAKDNLGGVVTRVLASAGVPNASAAEQNPLVQQAIKEAPNYLAQFSYSAENTLVLTYSPPAIQALLRQAQLIGATATTAQGVTLYVVNVKDFVAFKQVQAYLKTVAVIRNLTLANIEQDALQFNLLLDGDEQLLKMTLAAGDKLQAVTGDAQRPLSFRWQN